MWKCISDNLFNASSDMGIRTEGFVVLRGGGGGGGGGGVVEKATNDLSSLLTRS